MHRYSERLHQCRQFRRDVRGDFPDGDGRSRAELGECSGYLMPVHDHLRTDMGTIMGAIPTTPARNVGFDGNSITCLDIFNLLSHGSDNAANLMTQHKRKEPFKVFSPASPSVHCDIAAAD